MASLRHVIVEGPDGGGKTTLVKYLQEYLGLALRPRASTSLGGPVSSLIDWYTEDQDITGDPGCPPSIYDRHPVISEPIYAPLVRKQKPQPPFDNVMWLRHNKLEMATWAYVVWCLPPPLTVVDNVQGDFRGQLDGVVTQIRPIYQAYELLQNSWPGNHCQYDYTQHSPYQIAFKISRHIKGLPPWIV